MKITITEIEIKEAIRNHIRSLVTVKEGNSITMEFSATRGADGLTAFIDISPDAAAPTDTKAPAKQVTETQTSAQDVTPTRTRVTRPAAVKETTAATQEATEVETPAEAAPVAEEAPFDGGETVQSDEAIAPVADDGVQEVEGATPLKRSIFAGLNRPSNSEDSAAAA